MTTGVILICISLASALFCAVSLSRWADTVVPVIGLVSFSVGLLILWIEDRKTAGTEVAGS